MDLMDEIHERLRETERRAGEVVGHLEQLDSLQQSLDNAGQGLQNANSNIASLASATTTAVESLNKALVAFREAVEVIRGSDPAAIRETLARVEAEIGKIGAKLPALDELASDLQGTRKTITEMVQNSDRETKRLVEDAVKRLSRQTVIDRILGRYRSR